MADRLESGREAFARRAWADAYEGLTASAAEGFAGVDFERRAVAAYLVGKDDESAAAWEAAHRWHAEAGDLAEAARCSFWLALCLLLRGRVAQAGGWLSRTEGIIKSGDLDCAAVGYVLIPG